MENSLGYVYSIYDKVLFTTRKWREENYEMAKRAFDIECSGKGFILVRTHINNKTKAAILSVVLERK